LPSAILVDGKEWGKGAQITVELEPGGHDVVVKPIGRPAVSKHVELAAGHPDSITIFAPGLPPPKPPVVRTPPIKHDTPKPHQGDDDLLAPKHH
jgi:hypothetical protein